MSNAQQAAEQMVAKDKNTPTRFRKKADEVIEAMKLTEQNYKQVKDWVNETGLTIATLGSGEISLNIHAMGGITRAEVGDCIVKIKKNRFCIHKAEVFEDDYEPIQ